ncbi:OstA-like protein [Prevotella aurantiaca]|jgi:hypothetical protein|uniref:OstA-like protein n=1 Tax=Prevotella aurantiaca TaxID=596085 RepID=UPI003D2BEC58
MILCLFGLSISLSVSAQKNKQKEGAKVYIDHADILRHNQIEMPNVQIAKGNVKFRYKDMTLLCDSAYLNEQQNTFQAFGHVNLKRKDGTNVACQRAFYDGFMQTLRAREKVVVRQPYKSLKCDSLNYNMVSNVANYFGGRGTLNYGGNVVVADEGDYNTETHDANFYGNVVIRTPKYNINTPTAHGNTETGVMNVVGKSVIRTNRGEVVHTNDGTYNSKTDHMQLNGFSTIKSPQRDIEGNNIIYNSTTGDAEGHGNVKINDKVNKRTITGQDVVYNSKTGHTEGRGKVKIIDHKEQRTITGEDVIYNAKTGHSEGHGNVKIVDDLKKRTITGEHLLYNSKTHVGEGKGNVDYIDYKSKHAFKGDYVHYTDTAAIVYGGNPGPIAKDFSKDNDTLFVHADTISMKAFNINTPQVYRKIFGVDNVRSYRTDLQAVCGFLIANTKDSCLVMYQEPIVWSDNRQLLGDSIKVFMNDSTIREVHILGNALSIEELKDKQHYNQVSSKTMHAQFIDGKIRTAQSIGNVTTVYYPIEEKDSSLVGLNYLETDTMRVYLSPQQQLEKIWTNKFTSTLYPISQIPAEKMQLPNFHWYDAVRPKDKYDIFRKVARKDDSDIRPSEVGAPPRQKINN